MTTLLPWLETLQTLDKWVASRFACYASAILEHCKGHPIVCFEGSVFFERLSKHMHLIQSSYCCVVTTDDVATVVMPFLLSTLKPPVAKVSPDGNVGFSGCHNPMDVQRSAIMCLKTVVASDNDLNESAFEAGKVILECLHDRCGRRRFEHFSEFRSLALPRSVVNGFEDSQSIEAEAIVLVQALVKAQLGVEDEDMASFRCLQWLLFSSSLISGDSFKSEQVEAELEMSVAGLIERSRSIARSNASPIAMVSNPPRWQLKCVASNIASMAMATLLEIHENPSIFNLQSAKARCVEMLHKENNRVYGVNLHSFPVLHLQELVTTACIASAATSNNSELPSVQISGLRFLITVLRAFGQELDASTNDGTTTVLDQYSSQIISAVRHALNAESSLEETVAASGFHRLFATGCEALFVMIKGGFVSDPVVIRRLLQPLLLSPEDVPFATFGSKDENLLMKSNHVTDDSRSFPFFRLSKLCFAARLSMEIELGGINQSTVTIISDELAKEEIGKAIHSAAAAIDGFLLHRAQGSRSPLSATGMTFTNISDLDEVIVTELVENWPVLAAGAATSLVKVIKDSPEGSEQRETLGLWLSKLLPIILSGLRDALTEFNSDQSNPSVSDAAALLVCALRLLVTNSTSTSELCSDELGTIISMVTDSVIFKFLGLTDSGGGGEDCPAILPQSVFAECAILTQQACAFIEDLCENHSGTGLDVALLSHVVMKPLVALQEKQIKPHVNYSVILSSCIRSSITLLGNQNGGDRLQLEKALVQLSFSTLKDMADYPSELREELKEPCLSLLRSCADKTALDAEEWGDIATYSVSNELWDAWSIVCSSLPPGTGIKSSIDALKAALGDLENKARSAGAIVALRTALHSYVAKDPSLVSFVMHHVGFEVLQLLRAYSLRLVRGEGSDENQVVVCAESVKVNMIAFQYLSSTPPVEGTATSFLTALFQILVESVSFNGLPNHPSNKGGADESIGRMCAQVFVHIARSDPMMFKSTIAVMAADSRTILEGAVRADMSGYAAPKREKKKLSLKGFR
jgi:hypothetical protein